jgi:hypothetical protein
MEHEGSALAVRAAGADRSMLHPSECRACNSAVEIVRDDEIEQRYAPVALLDEGDGTPFDQPPSGRTTPTVNRP